MAKNNEEKKYIILRDHFYTPNCRTLKTRACMLKINGTRADIEKMRKTPLIKQIILNLNKRDGTDKITK